MDQLEKFENNLNLEQGMPASNLKGEAITRHKKPPQIQVKPMQLLAPAAVSAPRRPSSRSPSKLKSPAPSFSQMQSPQFVSGARSVLSGSRPEQSAAAPRSFLAAGDGLSVGSVDEQDGLLVLRIPDERPRFESKRSVLETLVDLSGKGALEEDYGGG